MNYSIFGLGKLGCSMLAAIANRGFNVIGVDINQQTIESVNNGIADETDLQKLLVENKDRIVATDNCEFAILNSDVSFVIVPTPSNKNGSFSLKYVQNVFDEIAKVNKESYHLIVLTSTVIPGDTRSLSLPSNYGLCYSPEFIALGSVIHDFLNPDFVLIGESDKKAGNLLERCYDELLQNNAPIKRMNFENAELTKLAINTFVTTKITFANMVLDFCEKLPGGDVDIVTDTMGLDSRIGRKYLTGALGYGGPCFPRDNMALSYSGKQLGIDVRLPKTVDKINKQSAKKTVDKLDLDIEKTIGILGLSYKPNTPVIDESPGVLIAKELIKRGYVVIGYDYQVKHVDDLVVMDSVEEFLQIADVVLITIPDERFKNLKFESDVIDFWRIL